MKRIRRFAVAVLGVAAVGCAESTMVRSYPPGAKLYVNDQFKGLTPMMLTVPRSEFADTTFRVRLEREGYGTTENVLTKRVCGGRIVGGVFTLGIVLLFKRPSCFASPQDFALAALPGQVGGEVNRQPTIDERLERIEKMREQGTITNEEYEHYRREIMKDL